MSSHTLIHPHTCTHTSESKAYSSRGKHNYNCWSGNQHWNACAPLRQIFLGQDDWYIIKRCSFKLLILNNVCIGTVLQYALYLLVAHHQKMFHHQKLPVTDYGIPLISVKHRNEKGGKKFTFTLEVSKSESCF